MRRLLEPPINGLLGLLGLEVRRKTHSAAPIDLLETVLEAVASCVGTMNVVQVGANDGLHGDPIHGFLMENRHSTRALLIEPQADIVPYLRDAYRDHPSVSVFNGAIGEGGTLVLFRIKPELWSAFRAPYLKGAPLYRAPSGVTSANREHVLRAVDRHLVRERDGEEAIEEIRVPCRRLPDLLAAMDFPSEVHLLQVDAEGEDDRVLHACGIDVLQPTVINFESKLLSESRRSDLEAFLRRHGYNTHHWSGSDTLAIRSASEKKAAPRDQPGPGSSTGGAGHVT